MLNINLFLRHLRGNLNAYKKLKGLFKNQEHSDTYKNSESIKKIKI